MHTQTHTQSNTQRQTHTNKHNTDVSTYTQTRAHINIHARTDTIATNAFMKASYLRKVTSKVTPCDDRSEEAPPSF